MLDGWGRRGAAGKALVALIGAIGCLAAVAYAATKPAASPTHARPSAGSTRRSPRPAKPQITRHPAKMTLSTTASFRLSSRQPKAGFECKLDRAKWGHCESLISYGSLAVELHAFYARARSSGRPSRPARFTWKQAQPVGFSIEQQPGLGPLYPGAPARPIPVLVANSNSEPIFLTGLRASVTVDPAGCSSAENLELRPSTASAAAPIEVPAGGSVSLPAQGPAPTIAMRDLSASQDACQSAQFSLAFSGDAYG